MYSYKRAITNDIKGVLNEYESRDFGDLYDDMFLRDDITGNGSGSYTFNTAKAKEYIDGDPDSEEYIRELIDEYCIDSKTVAAHIFDWEYWDVSIRCYLLGECLSRVLNK